MADNAPLNQVRLFFIVNVVIICWFFLKELKGIKLKWFNFKFKINLTPEIQFVCWHQVYKKYAISETIELIEPNIFLYVHCMSPLTSLCSLCWLEIQGCFHLTWEKKILILLSYLLSSAGHICWHFCLKAGEPGPY